MTKKIMGVLGVFAAVLIFYGAGAGTALAAPDLSNFTQTYFDDFNGTSVNTNLWQVMTQGPNWGPGEVGAYLPQNTTVSNGSLLLQGNNIPWTDTTTNHKFNYQASEVVGTGIGQQYGYFAVNATMPHNTVVGGAFWPAFWFMPAGGDWSYEIDVMEQFGQNQDQNVQPYLYGHLHWGNGAGQAEICKSPQDPTGTAFSGGPHTLAVDWEPNGGFAGNTQPYVAIYYDGVLCKGADNPTGFYTGPGVPNVPMHPILNNAIAGPGGSAVFPQTYKVDNFVAYKRNDVALVDQGLQMDPIHTDQTAYHPGDTVTFSGVLHAGSTSKSGLSGTVLLEDFCTDNPSGGYTSPCYNAALDNPAGGYFTTSNIPLPNLAANGTATVTWTMKLPTTIIPGIYQADMYADFPRQIIPINVVASGTPTPATPPPAPVPTPTPSTPPPAPTPTPTPTPSGTTNFTITTIPTGTVSGNFTIVGHAGTQWVNVSGFDRNWGKLCTDSTPVNGLFSISCDSTKLPNGSNTLNIAAFSVPAGVSGGTLATLNPTVTVNNTVTTPTPTPSTPPPAPAPTPTPTPTPAPTTVPTPTPNTIHIGARVQTTAKLNVRVSPSSLAKKSCTQSTGAIGTVVDGPVVASGYTWWNVNYDSNCDGWSIQNYLVPAVSNTLSSGLTVAQANAVISLLQSFGASVDALAQVRTILGL